MSRNRFRVLALCLSLGVAVPLWAADDEQQKIPRHPAVAGADWTAVTSVVVELDDNNYEPNELSFKWGKPYKLVLKNRGGAAHDMVGGSFFAKDVIALYMVNSKVGRVTADDVSSIYIRPKNETEVWFVPVKKGAYDFFCSIPGHREAGMEGNIKIVD